MLVRLGKSWVRSFSSRTRHDSRARKFLEQDIQYAFAGFEDVEAESLDGEVRSREGG